MVIFPNNIEQKKHDFWCENSNEGFFLDFQVVLYKSLVLSYYIVEKWGPCFCLINQKEPETGWSLKICLVHAVYPSLPWLRQPVLNHRNSSWVCLADIILQSVVWQKKVKAWNYQSVLCNFHAVIYACHINHLAAHIFVRRGPLARWYCKDHAKIFNPYFIHKVDKFSCFFSSHVVFPCQMNGLTSFANIINLQGNYQFAYLCYVMSVWFIRLLVFLLQLF